MQLVLPVDLIYKIFQIIIKKNVSPIKYLII